MKPYQKDNQTPQTVYPSGQHSMRSSSQELCNPGSGPHNFGPSFSLGMMGSNAATAGVFPSKPLSQAVNQPVQRPGSAMLQTSSQSPKLATTTSTSYPVPAPRSGTSAAGQNLGRDPQQHIRQGHVGIPNHYQFYPSLSGSETDVSTSNENLTQEERYLLKTMERLDPQGEENGDPMTSFHQINRLLGNDALLQSNTSLRMQQLQQHYLQQQQQHHHQQQLMMMNRPTLYFGAASGVGTPMPGSRLATPTAGPLVVSTQRGLMNDSQSGMMFPNAVMPKSLHDEMWSGSRIRPASPMVTSAGGLGGASSLVGVGDSSLSKLNPSVYSHPNAQDPVLMLPKGHRDMAVLGGRRPNVDITSSGAFFDPRAVSRIGKDTSQAEILAQLTRELKLQQQAGGGTFSYSSEGMSSSSEVLNASVSPGDRQKEPSENSISPEKPRSSDEKQVSNSDPSIESKAGSTASLQASDGSQEKKKLKPQSNETLRLSQQDLSTGLESPQSVSSDLATVVTYAVTNSGTNSSNAAASVIIEALKNENRDMKSEIMELRKKVSKVNQLEDDMSKVHQAYQSLLKHSEKREQLEKVARAKLQAVIVNLSDANKEVAERHETVMAQLMSGDMKNQNIPGLDSILRGEILRKDALVKQLMEQNKMLLIAKERQEVEMTAQGETLEEQRAHIQILDAALSNAQGTIARLEEENRMKEGYAERVKQMTKSLEHLQAASEKREAMEKKLRAKLEEELKELRSEQRHLQGGPDTLDELRMKLHEFEEKIIRLEAERTQWEQRYFEESAMRQVAIDAASFPKDAKIAALEKNSAESEKIIAEARSDKMKQFEELQHSQRKVSDLENLVKTYETNLAERDATIRILKSSKSLHAAANFEDLFAAAHEKVTSQPNMSHMPNIMSVMDTSNILSIPIQQQQQQQAAQQAHNQQQQTSLKILHNKSLSHLMSPSMHSTSPSLTANMATVSRISSPALMERMTPSSGMMNSAQQIPSTSLLNSLTSQAHISNTIAHHNSNHMQSANLMTHSGLTPYSHALTPQSYNSGGFHHIKQLSTPSVSYGPGSRLTPNFNLGKGRSLTPSADMLLRSSTPGQIAAMEHLKSGRRDSAPGDVYSSSSITNIRGGPTLINTSDLFTSVGLTLTGGGTIPKMSMAVFKDANRSHMNPVYVSRPDSCHLDDTIGSFIGSVTPTRIDGSPLHNSRHETSKSYDGSKNFIEGIWHI